MKATLEYTLPEDQDELSYALKGMDSLLLIADLLSEIRSAIKYEGGAFTGIDDDALQKIREWIYEQKRERSIPDI